MPRSSLPPCSAAKDIKCLPRQLLICNSAFSKNTDMLSLSSITFLIGLIVFDKAIAAPTSVGNQHSIKERHDVPRGWIRIGAVPDSHLINLHIGLRQNDQAEIEKHVLQASNPSHPGYGQHLSAGEARKLIAPSDETVRMVSTWLVEHDITTAILSPSGDWITARISVRKVECLLNTTYSVYQHHDGSTLIRAPEWSLPQYPHDQIELIQPTTSFYRASNMASVKMPERQLNHWDESVSKDPWKIPFNHVSPARPRYSLCKDMTEMRNRIPQPATLAFYVMPQVQISMVTLSLLSVFTVYVVSMEHSTMFQRYLIET